MSDFSRREIIAGAAATIAATALPVAAAIPASEVAPAEIIPAWAVGTPGEFDWAHVVGRTKQEAIRNFMCNQIGGDGCEEGEQQDCDCEWCFTIGGLEAERKTIWDGLKSTTGADWMRAGMGAHCSRCSEETFPQEGGHVVADEVVCPECMSLEDWDIIDPEHAAELRAEEVARLSRRVGEAKHD